MARGKEDKMAILKICVEIEVPHTVIEEIADNGLFLDQLEDGLSETIADTVSEILPQDISLNDCYPVGWDV